jgi:hypothetical protein
MATIRERLAAATPGPWFVFNESGICSEPRGESGWPTPPDGRLIVTPWNDDEAGVDTGTNAALIANAPSDLTYLLDRLDALETRDSARESGTEVHMTELEPGTELLADEAYNAAIAGYNTPLVALHIAIRTYLTAAGLDALEVEERKWMVSALEFERERDGAVEREGRLREALVAVLGEVRGLSLETWELAKAALAEGKS